MTKPKKPKAQIAREKRDRRRKLWRLDPPRIATVDPGASAGIAVWELEGDEVRLEYVEQVKGDDSHAVLQALRDAAVDKVLVECAYLDSTMGINRAVHRWEVVAELLGLPWDEVWPSQWQALVPGIGGATGRDGRMQAYRDTASEFVGREVSPDEGAAVWIGRWYWAERGVEVVG